MSQDTHATTTNALGWDPLDPHGINPHDDAHHEHFIADWRMQVIILALLLFFTALTVGFYNLEQWIENSFDILLPRWVNIAGAMSIAVVKAVLVAAFFMQLKYDKVLNTFVMLFCMFCVGLFLTFTMIDLGSRHMVDPKKAPLIISGGTGYGLNDASADEEFSARIGPKVNTGGMSLVDYARLHGNKNNHGLLHYRENGNEGEFWAHFYDGHATHRDGLDTENYFEQLGFGHHAQTSSANASHPRHGLTPGLFSDVAPAAQDNHGASHGSDESHATDEHATEPKSDGH